MSMLITLIIGSKLCLTPLSSAAIPLSPADVSQEVSSVVTMENLADTIHAYLAATGNTKLPGASLAKSPMVPSNPSTSSPTPATTSTSDTTSSPAPSPNSGQSSPNSAGSSTSATSEPSTPPPSAGGTSANASSADLAAAQQMLSLINQARVSGGQAAMTNSSDLAQLAQERADAMITDGYFSEDSPVYGLPIQMETAAGIDDESMGAENIAEAPTIAEAFALLMASPPHEANIMAAYFTQAGIGAAYSPTTGWVVSELFAGPTQ